MNSDTLISPKISVVTICYNCVNEIERTILSVINQNYSNIEYIVIDGGSNDGTVNVIEKYLSHIAVFVSESDKGIYDAMNKGIDKATGEWICFINSGDLFCDNMVLSEFFAINYDADVLYGDVIIDYSQYGRILKTFNLLKDENIPLDICHQSTFIRTKILKKYMYDISFKIYADINAFYLMWQDGYKYQYIPKAIAVFEGLEGISSTHLLKGWCESMRVRNYKWYNSILYWEMLVKVLIKKLILFLIGGELYNKMKFNRLASKYIKI